MFDNRPFQISLTISFVVHSIILFAGLPRLNLFPDAVSEKNKRKELEVSYYQIKSKPLIHSRPQAPSTAKLSVSQKAAKPPPSLERKATIIEHKPEITDARLESYREKAATFTVDLSNIVTEFKGEPQYLNYFQAIRERIRQKALANYPRYPISGEVTLSFALASSGQLQSLKIVNEKSTQNQYLRDAALESIKEASPYPPFPPSFRQSEITFNILISFELGR